MIRPIDLQNSILQSIQSAPAIQRAEEAPRLAAQAAQAAFAAEVTLRDETVGAVQEAAEARVGAKPDKERERPNARGRKPVIRFEELADDLGGGSDEPAHLVDFTA